MYSKDQQRDLAGGRQLGCKHKAGVCKSVRYLGEDAAAVAWTCLYLPQEGGWQEDFPECPAASIRPTPVGGKGGVTGN